MERDSDPCSDHSHADESESEWTRHGIFDVFGPCRTAFERLIPTTSDDDSLEPIPRDRGDLLRLTITVIGLWDAVYTAAAVDIHLPAPAGGIDLSLYSDGMLAYNLLNTIWGWNGLDNPASSRPDHDDVELARALVRFLDLALGTDYFTDLRKRSEEALGNMLVAFPDLLSTMLDEAETRSFAPGLQSAIEAMSQKATAARENRRQ